MMTVAILLAAVTAAAAPAMAQATDQYGPGGGAAEEETDLVAELAVECPENQPRAIGYRLVTTGVESLTSVALTDEDGDGVLTGTQTFPKYPPGPQPSPDSGIEPITVPDVRIVAPDGSTIKQFGPVSLDQDEIVLPATISFCDGGSGTDQYSNGGQYDPSSGGTVSAPPSGNGTGLGQLDRKSVV